MPELPLWTLIPSLLVAAQAVAGEQVYLAPAVFVMQALGAGAQPQVLWLTKPMQLELTVILGHPPAQLRQRYWIADDKTAWILEEIGKEEPITAGFVVKDGRIEMARVLIYRESRGGEIRYPAFLKQYADIGLTAGGRLNKEIDGVAGATLSVNAMGRMARAALYLHHMSRTP